MALAIIRHLTGGDDAVSASDLQRALAGGQVEITPTTWEFADTSGHRVVFTGSFKAFGDVVQNGTVTGFALYDGDTRLMTGSGFDLTDDAVLEAREGAIADDYTVFYPVFFDRVREIGSALSDRLYGSTEKGKFLGMDGDDFIYGDEGRDVMKGGNGDDWVEGRGGSDRLFGDDGSDTFAFTNADRNHDPGADFAVHRIEDFDPGEDRIFLDAGRFTALDPGPLAVAAIARGRRADAPEEHVIFHRKTGELFYDEDGAGGTKKILFAELDPGLKLKAHHFEVDFVA
jgi:Ca2+-binding RTX toxin-like protein